MLIYSDGIHFQEQQGYRRSRAYSYIPPAYRPTLSHISGFSLSLPTLGKVIAETFQKMGFAEGSNVKLASNVDRITSAQQGQKTRRGTYGAYVLISICANLKPLDNRCT